jgi:D-3-phosphoglycerate dehydrogenase / 2-oxoglutarate reductase
MYKIQTLNKIAGIGLEKMSRDIYEIASEMNHPDGILVRSADMLQMQFQPNLMAVGRAGAGVNNIPVDRCTQQGIVVFNTPGANANAVKELAIFSLLLCSRKIIDGINYCKSLTATGKELTDLIEKNKTNFVGPEIAGKKLGIIGLGAIGVGVANSALGLGMEVEGHDPFITVDAAWNLYHDIKKAKGLDRLIATSDYLTLHLPQTEQTKGLINGEKISHMKKGVRIINLSRGGLVVEKDLIAALKTGQVAAYVTDFASEALLKTENVICFPHLGASTPEAEDNCAVMVVNQFREFFENGNITNSVNFPSSSLERQNSGDRIIIVNRNVPNMVGQFTTILAGAKINIMEMLNKSKGDIAYNIVDVENAVCEDTLGKLRQIEGVIKVRAIQKN